MEIFAFLSWDILATFSGAVGLTCIIVQLLKLPLDKVWHIPTRYLVFVICLAIMLCAQWFTARDLSLAAIAIIIPNAILGALSAMSLYEQVIELPERQKLIASYEYMTGVPIDDAVQTSKAESVKAHNREAETTAKDDSNGETEDDTDTE